MAAIEIDGVCRNVSSILRPLLAQALYPRRFSGSIGVAINVKNGSVCHYRESFLSQYVPGAEVKGPPGEPDIEHILSSAIDDLRDRLKIVQIGFYGAINLCLKIDHGICSAVNCGHERSQEPLQST
jgi:hypothetical protein